MGLVDENATLLLRAKELEIQVGYVPVVMKSSPRSLNIFRKRVRSWPMSLKLHFKHVHQLSKKFLPCDLVKVT
uniref:Uncharacterized protein n=1 Tax=Arundo donax TaxID=35708 RepID=A0A0A9AAR9_ARUDO